jgi:putative hemolysin
VRIFVGIGWQLGLVGVLVLLNAVFAGSEIALISLREGQLRRMEQHGGNGRVVAALARDPNRFLATIQIGITLAGFLASATAAVTLAEPLIELLGLFGQAARPVAIVLVTAVLTFVTLVVGELAPKRVAMQRPEGWSLLVARPLSGLATLARPAVWLLGKSTDVTVRLLGGDPSLGRDAITQEEIRDMIATGGLYSREERQIITGALEATDRVLREVVRPRPTVLTLRGDLTTEQALRRLVEAGHSRAPVYRQDVDDADRVISVLDLVGATGTVDAHARPALALPESVALIDALRRLQAERQSLALVVDEYGGLEGIVTVEDLVEELVGEIHDEYDRDVRDVVRHPDGSVTVVGHFPIHDLVDIGVDLPEGEYVTVAGLVIDRLQRMAQTGDRVTVGDWGLDVLAVRGRSIQQIRIVRHPEPTPAPSD